MQLMGQRAENNVASFDHMSRNRQFKQIETVIMNGTKN